ncbi:MAG TPA: RecQ family ATP-dependent DNA helicase [Solirubrobacteraceae bacterium]
METILHAIDEAKRELTARPEEQARLRARELLAQARELWVTLAERERQELQGPASELRLLLDTEAQPQGPSASPEELLERFGLRAFRPGQREAVKAALDGRDSLVVMPTGGGKSLCYQLPALAGDGLVLVVSPLIALMADQLRRLEQSGVHASMLASGMPEGHNQQALEDVRSGRTQLLLIAPERFASRALHAALSERRLALFVVDEAHCVSEWGHDFRPDYLRLHAAIEALGRPAVMAATATATPRVAREIAQRLGLRDWVSVRSGFDRPNLTFDVVSVEGKGAMARKWQALRHVLGASQGLPAIVYCGTRKDVENITDRLLADGVAAVGYHAGMAPESRRENQAAFMDGRAEVVVATNAFGMGVDKGEVMTVAHWALPTSLEAYYQEAGRAGRDGQQARALLLASRADLGRLIRFINDRQTTVDDVTSHVARLRVEAHDGVVAVSPESLSDRDRVLLSIAERSGAVRLSPGGADGLLVTLTGEGSRQMAAAAIKTARDRAWESYRSIERYAAQGEVCRRRQILEHFGDDEAVTATGRCCDVCSPDPDLARAITRAASVKPRRGRNGTRLPGVPGAQRDDLPEVPEQDFQALKAWRLDRSEGKPAFTVASDATLRELLAGPRARAVEDLLGVKGIGPAFCAKHGESLLEVLAGL